MPAGLENINLLDMLGVVSKVELDRCRYETILVFQLSSVQYLNTPIKLFLAFNQRILLVSPPLGMDRSSNASISAAESLENTINHVFFPPKRSRRR
jgi:hypothetical protein